MSGNIRTIAHTALRGSGSYAANACSRCGTLDEEHTNVKREESEKKVTTKVEEGKETVKDAGKNEETGKSQEEETNEGKEGEKPAEDTKTNAKREEPEKEVTTELKKEGKEPPKHPETNVKREESEEEETNQEKKVKELAKDVGKFLLGTAVISGAVIGGTALVLPAIGFGALGPVAGSLAAMYQSSVLGGTIASGSVFATLQSVGMAGLTAGAQSVIVGGSAVVSAAATAAGKAKTNDKNGKGSTKK